MTRNTELADALEEVASSPYYAVRAPLIREAAAALRKMDEPECRWVWPDPQGTVRLTNCGKTYDFYGNSPKVCPGCGHPVKIEGEG